MQQKLVLLLFGKEYYNITLYPEIVECGSCERLGVRLLVDLMSRYLY